MKTCKLFVLALAVLCSLSVPASVPTAQAATVMQPDPGGNGYTPCACICLKVAGKNLCFCVCDNS